MGVKNIQRETGCKVVISVNAEPEPVVALVGSFAEKVSAIRIILQMLHQASEADQPSDLSSFKLMIPYDKVGWYLGKQGVFQKMLGSTLGVKLHVREGKFRDGHQDQQPTFGVEDMSIAELTGDLQNVDKAVELSLEKMEQLSDKRSPYNSGPPEADLGYGGFHKTQQPSLYDASPEGNGLQLSAPANFVMMPQGTVGIRGGENMGNMGNMGALSMGSMVMQGAGGVMIPQMGTGLVGSGLLGNTGQLVAGQMMVDQTGQLIAGQRGDQGGLLVGAQGGQLMGRINNSGVLNGQGFMGAGMVAQMVSQQDDATSDHANGTFGGFQEAREGGERLWGQEQFISPRQERSNMSQAYDLVRMTGSHNTPRWKASEMPSSRSGERYSEAEEDLPAQPLHISLERKYVAKFIGKGGEHLKEITQRTGCVISVSDSRNPEVTESTVTFKGSLEQNIQAYRLACSLLGQFKF
ncbi:hypothetical protein CYMTET_54123 [Cymbomonas tetramitiformis]|uniref:K Homology domain-containing protein n=1 Tax=Cymbomonas tetramitiformis TaxID=36881 RepID=A0AAE0BGU2_9CHLO|nr:hypothetical protein CYMTET_54123 [Cymbomonas tetramitiformis]